MHAPTAAKEPDLNEVKQCWSISTVMSGYLGSDELIEALGDPHEL